MKRVFIIALIICFSAIIMLPPLLSVSAADLWNRKGSNSSDHGKAKSETPYYNPKKVDRRQNNNKNSRSEKNPPLFNSLESPGGKRTASSRRNRSYMAMENYKINKMRKDARDTKLSALLRPSVLKNRMADTEMVLEREKYIRGLNTKNAKENKKKNALKRQQNREVNMKNKAQRRKNRSAYKDLKQQRKQNKIDEMKRADGVLSDEQTGVTRTRSQKSSGSVYNGTSNQPRSKTGKPKRLFNDPNR